MPEFRITNSPLEYANEAAADMEEKNDQELCRLLGLADIPLPRLLHNPLPLQCLAAEALPGNLKQEIDQLTKSSIKEVNRSSTTSSSGDSNKSNSLESSEEVNWEMVEARVSEVSVPLQFFSNGMGLRLVGGVMCSHSNEVHARIVCMKKKKEGETIPDQVAILNGQCVLELNGHSLKGASFELVRKLTKDTKDILVNLMVKDCCRGPSNGTITTTQGTKTATSAKSSQEVMGHPKLLNNMQKARAFKRRFSIESLHTQPHSSTGRTLKSHSRSTSNIAIQNDQNTKQLRKQPHSTTNLRLNPTTVSSPPSTLNLGPLKESSGSHTVVSVVASPMKSEERSLNLGPLKESSGSHTVVSVVASPMKSEERSLNLGPLKESSGSHTVVSVVASPMKSEERSLANTTATSLSVPGSPANKRKGHNVKEASKRKLSANPSVGLGLECVSKLFNHNMPTAMIQLALNYVKSLKTLYISLFKVKCHSITLGSEGTGYFCNTYIFPDKREQGVKFSKVVPPTLATDELHSRSASYILTEDEVRSSSVRVIIWEQSSQTFGTKKHTFKGEVFLDLNDDDVVNLHGVPQSYTICDPDPNLPSLPKVFYNHGGTFVQKMMDSTFGTLKKKKKELIPKEDGPIKGAGSMMDLSDNNSARSDQATPIPKILEPLKDKQEDTPTYCKVMLRPATVERSSSDDNNGMSLFDFLSSVNPIADSNDTRQGLPAKSPLFSSYHELRTAAERPVSILSDGNNSMSHPVKHRRRGSLFSLIDSINNRASRVSTESRNSSILSRQSMFSTGSELSSSISSLSMEKPKTDPQRGWSDPDGNSSLYDSTSDTSLQSSNSSNKAKHHYSPNHRHSPQPNSSPLHNSIMFGRSLSPEQSPSLTDSTKQVDVPDGADSPVNDGSYSCEQVAIVSTVQQHVEQDDVISTSYSPSSSSITVTPSSYAAHTFSTDCSSTAKDHSSVVTDSLALSPLTQSLQVPLASTPKKSPPGNVKLSKSMGNMSDELFFMDDEETDATSLGEFMQKELSCLDSTNSRTNFHFSSQEDLSSSSNSQRDALESSTHSSSLDFSSSQPSPSTSYRQHKPSGGGDPLGALIEESGEHRPSPRTSRTLYVVPTGGESPLSPYQKHKWSSLDNLKISPKIDAKKSPARLRARHNSSLVRKLSSAYSNGKSAGSIQINISAKCVMSQISVEIVDVVFFNQKLMNGDFEVHVSLYNRLNEGCETTLKGQASLKKDGTEEEKTLPPVFVFAANPMMFYLQVTFRLSNKVFGKKQFHVWLDVKDIVSKPFDHAHWFRLNKLS